MDAREALNQQRGVKPQRDATEVLREMRNIPPSTLEPGQAVAVNTAGQFTPGNPTTLSDLGRGVVTGFNQLLPNLLGLPVDTAQNLGNLGIAGFNTIQNELFGPQGFFPQKNQAGVATRPEPIPLFGPQPGGSQSIQALIESAFNAVNPEGGSPFALNNPNDPNQQLAQTFGTVLGGSLLTRNPRLTSSVASAAGATSGQALAPDQPLAPLIGALAPTAIARGVPIPLPPRRNISASAKRFREQGFVLRPTDYGKGIKKDTLEGLSGRVPFEQLASVRNQRLINQKVRQQYGIPDDVPLPQGLDDAAAAAGQAFERAKQLGPVRADRTFISNIRKIANPELSSRFPNIFPKTAKKQALDLAKRQFDAAELVELTKQLRAESRANLRNPPDATTRSLGNAQKALSDQIDDLLIRQAEGTSAVAGLKDARRTIAGIRTIQEKALKGENVDARALGRLLDRKVPLQGQIKDIAEFGQKYKKLANPDPAQTQNLRGLDAVAGLIGSVIDPKLAAVVLGRPGLRQLLLSEKGQNALAADQGRFARGIESIANLPRSQQVGALNLLLQEINQATPPSDTTPGQ